MKETVLFALLSPQGGAMDLQAELAAKIAAKRSVLEQSMEKSVEGGEDVWASDEPRETEPSPG